ncbi:hypothetical protein R6Z07F_013962 [Ovis aries]
MPGAFDWSPVVKYVCELEGNRNKWAEKEERACRDALRHLRTLLRPGGHLVLSGSFESTFFMVGDKRFPTLPLNEKFLREALQEAGFIIEKLEKVARAAETHVDNRTDYTGLFFLVAQRGD